MGRGKYLFHYQEGQGKDKITFKDYVAKWITNTGLLVLKPEKDDKIKNEIGIDLVIIDENNKFIVKTVNTSYEINEELVEHFGEVATNIGGKPVLITNGSLSNNAYMTARVMGVEAIVGSMLNGLNDVISMDKINEQQKNTLMGLITSKISNLLRMGA